MYEYRIGDIIPEKIARQHEEALLKEEFSEKDLKEIIESSKLWSLEVNFELENNKAFKLNTENAFGDWVILKISDGIPFIWNLNTLEKRFLNIFELYVLLQEFQINKFNSLNMNAFDDIVIKNGKKYINGEFVEVLKPLGKINYNFDD